MPRVEGWATRALAFGGRRPAPCTITCELCVLVVVSLEVMKTFTHWRFFRV